MLKIFDSFRLKRSYNLVLFQEYVLCKYLRSYVQYKVSVTYRLRGRLLKQRMLIFVKNLIRSYLPKEW